MANRRFELYQYRQIVFQMRQGLSDRQIAKAGLMGRTKLGDFREIARQAGWLDQAAALPEDAEIAVRLEHKSPKPSASLILPFKETVESWLKQGIQSTTIYRALQRKFDFKGSYSSVRRFAQQWDQNIPKDVTVILDFAPGEAAQVDFGSGAKLFNNRTGKVEPSWFFVMTLAWSRHQYAEMVFDQKVETWLECHRRAFEFFGGVPKRLIIDNLKSAICRASYHDPEVQRSYGELAEGYGFIIAPCPPHDPKKKGRVESGVKYIKRAFLPLREFRDIYDANRQLIGWVMGEAGNRTHGTTYEKPLTLFAETEQGLLQPLPDIPVQISVWAKVKVHGNCHVQYEKCRYSVPFKYVGQQLWMKITPTTSHVYFQYELVAIHPRLRKPGTRSTVDDHMPPDAIAYKMRDPQWCLQQAETIGASCLQVIEYLFSDRVIEHLNAAQGIVGFKKRFGEKRLEASCARALQYDTISYRSVKMILERGLDQIIDEPNVDTAQPAIYNGGSRFCRNTQSLLTN